MRSHGHPVLGAIAGLFFGLFLDAFLVIFSVFATDSIWLAVIPIAGIVLGIVWGLWAPLGRRPVPPAESQPMTVDTAPPGP